MTATEVWYKVRDAEGKVREEVDQNGLTVKTGYDLLGSAASWDYGPSSVTGSLGDVETVTRDPNGVPTERIHGSYTWVSRSMRSAA